MESKRNAAKTYVQEHFDELTPEMRAAVEDLLSFLAEAKIEYVDERHLKFNNLTFCKNAAGYYRAGITLHQYVWIFHNGEIPQGCGIHHGEGGKECNEIHNLTMKTNSEHATGTKRTTSLRSNARTAAKNFRHAKPIAASTAFVPKFANINSTVERIENHCVKKTCVICGKTFLTRTPNAKTCSESCRRIQQGITRRERNSARKADK